MVKSSAVTHLAKSRDLNVRGIYVVAVGKTLKDYPNWTLMNRSGSTVDRIVKVFMLKLKRYGQMLFYEFELKNN